MKYFISVIFIICSFTLSAQKYYAGLQIGNGFATNAGQANFTDIEINDTLSISEIKTGGFGEGVYFSAHFGRHYNSFFSYELQFNYLLGRTITNEEKYYSAAPLGGYVNELTISQNIRTLMISPRLVFTIPNESNLTAYAKIGLTFGAFVKANHETTEVSIGGVVGRTEYHTKRVLQGGIPFGFTSSLGAKYEIDDNFSLLAELNLLNMVYRPYTNSVTEFTVDGNNSLDNLTTRQREIEYSNKVENNNTVDDSQPQKILAISLPMSNISFNIGLQVNL